MQDDVRRLFEAIGVPELRYREVGTIERGQAAAARWPLLAATSRILAARAPAQASSGQKARRRRGVTVAVASLRGGAGRTTVAAHLAAILQDAGRRALAVDFDPQNSLGLHFGLEPGEASGVSSKEVGARQAQALLARFRGGAGCIPFGRLPPQDLMSLEFAIALEQDWLKKRLDELQPADTEIVILDTPPAPSPWAEQAIAAADAVVMVLRPDAASYATLPAIEDFLAASPAAAQARVRFLVNGYDERRELDRDVLAALRGYLAERALPFVVHADDAVAESLARRQLLAAGAGGSQAAADLRLLAEWTEGVGDQLLAAPSPANTLAAELR